MHGFNDIDVDKSVDNAVDIVYKCVDILNKDRSQ
jgi:hypothetical protein